MYQHAIIFALLSLLAVNADNNADADYHQGFFLSHLSLSFSSFDRFNIPPFSPLFLSFFFFPALPIFRPLWFHSTIYCLLQSSYWMLSITLHQTLIASIQDPQFQHVVSSVHTMGLAITLYSKTGEKVCTWIQQQARRILMSTRWKLFEKRSWRSPLGRCRNSYACPDS